MKKLTDRKFREALSLLRGFEVGDRVRYYVRNREFSADGVVKRVYDDGHLGVEFDSDDELRSVQMNTFEYIVVHPTELILVESE